MITEKEGYEAMLYLLRKYYFEFGKNDLSLILSLGEYVEPGIPADGMVYEYWKEAIEKVKSQGPPPLKALHQ
ncbi:MAG: hypothetical protein H6600_06755 [Flavobacteriales bacterium]|nr:hypothetical protein [Flavobacteriales bacterium]